MPQSMMLSRRLKAIEQVWVLAVEGLAPACVFPEDVVLKA